MGCQLLNSINVNCITTINKLVKIKCGLKVPTQRISTSQQMNRNSVTLKSRKSSYFCKHRSILCMYLLKYYNNEYRKHSLEKIVKPVTTLIVTHRWTINHWISAETVCTQQNTGLIHNIWLTAWIDSVNVKKCARRTGTNLSVWLSIQILFLDYRLFSI